MDARVSEKRGGGTFFVQTRVFVRAVADRGFGRRFGETPTRRNRGFRFLGWYSPVIPPQSSIYHAMRTLALERSGRSWVLEKAAKIQKMSELREFCVGHGSFWLHGRALALKKYPFSQTLHPLPDCPVEATLACESDPYCVLLCMEHLDSVDFAPNEDIWRHRREQCREAICGEALDRARIALKSNGGREILCCCSSTLHRTANGFSSFFHHVHVIMFMSMYLSCGGIMGAERQGETRRRRSR